MAAIKKWNGSVWEETYPKTTVGNIVTTGTPSSTTFLSGTGVWATPAGTSNHSHGNINSSGQITSAAQTVANGDYLLIRDVSNSSLVSTGPVFGTSTTTFLANDGVFRTPTGDVVGPASSVNARIATFNGTTGKLIQDSGFTMSNIAGSTNSTFWNPQNNQIAKFSSTIGWFTTAFINDLYSQRLTSDVEAVGDTNYVTVFSFTNLPAGTYQFLTAGTWQRAAGGVLRSLRMSITGSSNYTNLSAACYRANGSPSATGTSVSVSNLIAATSTLDTTNSFWDTSGSTGTVSAAPFTMIGSFTLSSTTTITVSMRQTSADAFSISRVSAGTTMNIMRVA
jgi:hypothetical protein